MANRKNPITLMLADNGVGWEYVAVLGTEKQYNRSAYKIYLHRRKPSPKRANVMDTTAGGEWWRFETGIPMVTARSESPYRMYPSAFSHVRGPVTAFPEWLDCMETRDGLVAAVKACRQLSGLEEVPSE